MTTTDWTYSITFAQRFNLLFLLLIGFPGIADQATAQKRHDVFWNYTLEDGLPSNEVFHIHQDRKGYMWFATSNGICRFDGYEFEHFGIEDGILDTHIFQIEEDSQGKLYLYGMSGRIFEGNEKGFRLFSFQHIIDSLSFLCEVPTGSPFGYIRISSENNFNYIRSGLWITFNKQGQFIFEKNHDFECKFINNDEFIIAFPPYHTFLDQKRITYDSIIFFTQTCPIQFIADDTISLDIKLTKSSYVNYETRFKKWNYVRLGDNEFIGYTPNSVWVVEHDSVTFQSDSIVDVEIIRQYNAGGIFIGQLSNLGISYFKNFRDIPRHPAHQWLKGNSISYLFVDHQGQCWISSTNGGIFVANMAELFATDIGFIRDIENINLLKSDGIEKLFLTTKKEELFEINMPRKSVRKIPRDAAHRIKQLEVQQQANTLFWVDLTLHKWDGVTADKIMFSRSFLSPLYERMGKGNLNISAANQGVHFGTSCIWTASNGNLMSIDKETLALKHMERADHLGPGSRIYCVFEEHESLIWLGSQTGIWTYDLDTIVRHPDPALQLEVPVYEIARSEQGTFFATRGKGVLRHKTGVVSSIEKKNGLGSNMITALMPMDSTELWVGTPQGLDRIQFQSDTIYKITYYSTSTGLPSNHINDIEYLDGWIYVSTPAGLGVIDPKAPVSTETINPIIREVLVNNETFSLDHLDHLKSSERNIIISYDCLDYKQLGNILYRYRLNQNPVWTETRQRTVNLLRLPPGKYTFEVQAIAADRTWSDSAPLRFTIAKPLVQREWFWVVSGLLIIGYVIFYSRNRLRKVKQEAQLMRKVSELERSALRAQMNPHFIFNVLHSIQGFIKEGESDKAVKYVSKFARLIRATLNNSRLTKIPLEDELKNIREYLDLESMRMNGQLTYEIQIDPGVDMDDIDIPPMLIQPFLENAIKHGISPKEAPGHIDIFLRQDQNSLLVQIMDNGIGIDQARQLKLKEKESRPSLGIEITRQRLALLEDQLNTDAVQMEELRTGSGEIMGTKVTLRIKLEDD